MGSKGSTLKDRLDKYGKVEIAYSQSNIYGCAEAFDIVMDAIICADDPQGTNRVNLFSPFHNRIGFHQIAHKTRGSVVVIVYVGLFTPHGQESEL